MNKGEKERLKRLVCDAIDRRSREIEGIGQAILENPELGFKEYRTSRLVTEEFQKLGLEPRNGLALTGVKAVLKGREREPTVAVIGELDAIVCPDHPDADPETGAAHACGHNAQIAGMLGVAMGLIESGVMKHLDGGVAFMAVPAEEYIELEQRLRWRREGRISFIGGKQELIRLGEFNDIDLAMMFHLRSPEGGERVLVGGTSNGFIAKLVKFKGKEAHAGAVPHLGVNALNAAMLALMGIHMQRETFREEDTVRVHPIITKGGDIVNVVPASVQIETFVRAKSIQAIMDANRKVNRALRAGASAVGAEVEVVEVPGSLPLAQDDEMNRLFRSNALSLLGESSVAEHHHGTGSTDMGDVSQVLPAVHPYLCGATGVSHARDFIIKDLYLAYTAPAKLMAMTVIDLLYDHAVAARRIKAAFKPKVKVKEFTQFWDRMLAS